MISCSADKSVAAVLLQEKNIVAWLISQADKFKQTEQRLLGRVYATLDLKEKKR
jgi:hypothetical protein